MANSNNVMTIIAARNGFSIKTRSGIYICKTVEELVKQVREYAVVLQREATQEQPAGPAKEV